ncbi:MAG: hypothetical protein LBT23_07690 [Synergistaceae bacterium]|jgi:hypothetical protein|nr:hypothetical protein [Synergistaceae bacterium]
MTDRMRMASALADSSDKNDIAKGFVEIAAIVSDKGSRHDAEFGFLDNALFLARKHASSKEAAVRNAVSVMLTSVGNMGSSWREAALETADEINMQPSSESQSIAAEVISELRRK